MSLRPQRFGLCCLLLLSGCVQGPAYVRPQVEAPETYRFDQGAELGGQVESAEGWWGQFGDEHLDGLVEEALVNNRDMRIAASRVDEFAAILAGTRSQALPQLGYGFSAGASRRSQQGLPGLLDPVSSSFSALLSASWELDLWGRIRRETEAAKANLNANEEARRGITLTIVAATIASYIRLLDLDEQLRITHATIEGRKKSVALFEKRLAAGWVSDFEMSQVRGEYEAAVAQAPPILQAIAIEENALSVLVGRNPGGIRRAASLDALVTPTVAAGIPSELLARRPDIRQAEQQLIASNALIGAARALFFPRISLTGVLGFASPSLGGLFTGPARTWSFTGDIAGPIYAGGGLQSAVDQAEARRDQSFAHYELVVQNAFRDAEDALARVKHSAELLSTLQRRVAVLQRTVELANERYDNGYSDYLEVLDSERSLFSAQLQLASSRGDHDRALVDLYRALGGDWTSVTPVTAQKGS